MGVIKLKKYPAATLVETIVASVIILIVFGIATMVLVQTSKTNYSTKKIRADYLIDQFAYETDQQKNFSDDEKQTDVFTLIKKIETHSFGQNVVVAKFSAIDKNGLLVSYQNRIFCLSKNE